MKKSMQESLLDQLLKADYPLTSYLCRQQDFHRVFSSTQTNTVATSSEYETSVIHKQKLLLPPCHKIPDPVNPLVPESNHAHHEINSDQEAHDQSSDIDDDATQEYDEKPLIKNINGKISVEQQ